MSDLRCPICEAAVAGRAENPAFPFCSHRCQLVDLGNWLDGQYRVSDQEIDRDYGGETGSGRLSDE